MSVCDAVDGSSTGTWVPWMWVLLRPPRFGGAIVSTAAIIVLRFFWPGMVVAFALLGVTSPSAVLGVIVGIVILSAAWLHAKLADSRPQWRPH
jgi:hypothetical protein